MYFPLSTKECNPDQVLLLLPNSLTSCSIALSNLDRGFDTDLADIVFLIRTGRLHFDNFERMVREALPHANKYDFNPDFLEHLQELKRRLK